MHRRHLVGIFLVLVTAAVYAQLGTHAFVDYNDDLYVTDNLHVQAGIRPENLLWAFTTLSAFNWHPITWLSHMLDVSLFGLNPRGHHLTSLLFHLANVLLLFSWLFETSGALWPAAFVAALFAVHPLQVESVAWVAERKNVLSTFFALLTLWAYSRYAKAPSALRYLGTLAFFILGLLAKPTLVTLPFLLLLLDYWPLRRVTLEQAPSELRGRICRLVLEKLPLFSLSAASCAVTYLAQQRGGSVLSLERLPLKDRVENALLSYVFYMEKFFWPSRLAPFYPLRDFLPAWQVAAAAALLTAISALAVLWVRRRPYFAVGWFWYLGSLVPVIGIVQVGVQASADHHTYFALVGLSIVVCWGIADLTFERLQRQRSLALLGGILIAVLAGATAVQASRWQDGVRLFSYTLTVMPDNYLAHHNLGIALAQKGNRKEAIFHYTQALAVKPNFSDAHNSLGAALGDEGKTGEAEFHFRRAIEISPGFERAQFNLANILVREGRFSEAIAQFLVAIQLNPEDGRAHNSLGIALAEQGRVDEAIAHFNQALSINPGDPAVHYNLGVTLAGQGRFDDAVRQFRQSLSIDPRDVQAHNRLGLLLAQMGKPEEAAAQYNQALSINPSDAMAHYNLGVVRSGAGRLDEAEAEYREALRLQPSLVPARNNLGMLLARQGKLEEAVAEYTKALAIDPRHERAHFNLALALARQAKFAEALPHLDEAIQLKPDDPLAHDIRGQVYYKLGRAKDAITEFKRALEIDPQLADARAGLELAVRDQAPASGQPKR